MSVVLLVARVALLFFREADFSTEVRRLAGVRGCGGGDCFFGRGGIELRGGAGAGGGMAAEGVGEGVRPDRLGGGYSGRVEAGEGTWAAAVFVYA